MSDLGASPRQVALAITDHLGDIDSLTLDDELVDQVAEYMAPLVRPGQLGKQHLRTLMGDLYFFAEHMKGREA